MGPKLKRFEEHFVMRVVLVGAVGGSPVTLYIHFIDRPVSSYYIYMLHCLSILFEVIVNICCSISREDFAEPI
jgi:hypothetical protein